MIPTKHLIEMDYLALNMLTADRVDLAGDTQLCWNETIWRIVGIVWITLLDECILAGSVISTFSTFSGAQYRHSLHTFQLAHGA